MKVKHLKKRLTKYLRLLEDLDEEAVIELDTQVNFIDLTSEYDDDLIQVDITTQVKGIKTSYTMVGQDSGSIEERTRDRHFILLASTCNWSWA